MFKFDHIDMQRTAVSGFGALLFSAACVFGAVGPAKAETPVSIDQWQSNVQKQIDNHLAANGSQVITENSKAVVRVMLDGNSKVASAKVIESTGVAALDEEALRTARSVAYPVLPARLSTQHTSVALEVFFGRTPGAIAKEAAAANANASRHNQRYAEKAARTKISALTQG